MNPKISIVVDAKNKAISTLTGMVTVGSKVDVEISGLPSVIPSWGQNDDYNGPSVRFRIVDELGKDIVRFPNVKKTTATDGDQWNVTGVSPNQVYKTYNGTSDAQVDFDTDLLRKAFRCVPFNEYKEFGIIIDSIVDSAQYAIGKIKIRQWSVASTEDPTVLPDWRETLSKLKTDLASVEQSKTAAQTYASQAESAKNAAVFAQGQAEGSASAALGHSNNASQSATSSSQSAISANDNRILAQSAKASAEAAKLAAEVAVTHYPKIGANENWYVWDVVNGVYVDTGYCANGGHNIFKGKTFARPSNAKGWYELIAHLIIEMGGNIQTEGITPGSSPSAITMTASDGAQKMLKIVKSNDEYTTEVV